MDYKMGCYKLFLMKKNILIILILSVFFSSKSLAESYYFKTCKINQKVMGNYIIDVDKKIIEVILVGADGTVQKVKDKIKSIEKHKIVSEKIKSGEGKNVYFEYYLNSKTKKVIKLQYKKESGLDMDLYKILSKRESECKEVKSGWDKDKIEKASIDKEQERILKAQEKIRKEQSSLIKCEGGDYRQWTKCVGLYKANTGHEYEGLFKNGKIIKGTALFPDGATYVGEFKNYKPNGYGTFSWTNGDKYYGEWKDGKSHGIGTKIWTDGREYSGSFKNDKLHGQGTFYYPGGKKYVGGFLNGKRNGEGTFSYPDGTAFIGTFVAGKQEGLGECVALDGSSKPCKSKSDTEVEDFSGKDTRKISLISKKWVRVSQYETNSKKGKKVMDSLKARFDDKAAELCLPKTEYKVIKKVLEVLDIDETPAYGLETKLQIGISGMVECI